MRLLHTADWHLGRTFHGEDLFSAQAAFVDSLVEVARSSRVDAVLLAGDVYDRALPPVGAVQLASEALVRLSEVAPVIAISGNHDSAARLGFGAELFARARVHVLTAVDGIGTPVVLDGALVYGIPYLEPDLVRDSLDADERGHGAVVSAAMARVRADVAARRAAGDARPVVVMAHAFVAGAVPSESERDLAVGGASNVPATVFAEADYVALGHLHGPQRVGANGRYAGSPLAFSFSEATHRKSTALVTLGASSGSAVEVELIPTPVLRPLATLRGTLDELLADPRLAEQEGAWVQATLTDPVRPEAAMERVRRRFPHAVVLAFDPQGERVGPDGSYARLRGLGDEELVRRFVADVRGLEAGDDELDLLRDALTDGRVAETLA